MLVSSNLYIDSLDRWVRAVQAGDWNAAKFEAVQLKLSGELLVLHPDFRKRFRDRCGGFDPEESLQLLVGFLLCTVES